MFPIASLTSWFAKWRQQRRSGASRKASKAMKIAVSPAEMSPETSKMPPKSRFLPANFDPSRGIILLAGRGSYPKIAAERIREKKIPLFLMAEGETDSALWESFSADHRARYRIGKLGEVLREIRQFGANYLLMSGQIAPKRLFRDLSPDWRALRLLCSLKTRNAETIFGAVANQIEKCGVSVLDARAFMDADLAQSGFMTRCQKSLEGLPHGIAMAKAIAELNIGQGVVVRRGTVLAAEGFDGTDALLRRCATFHIGDKLFVKTAKPSQDFRFDVPVIGEKTLDSLEIGGISGVAVETEKTLLLHREQFIQSAEQRGIAIYGYETAD